MNRVSAKRAIQLKEYAKLRRRFLKQNPTCQVCGKKPSRDIHHRKGRSNQLLNATEYWTAICRTCHDYLHLNPKQAQALNLIEPKGSWGIGIASKPSMRSGGSEPMGNGA